MASNRLITDWQDEIFSAVIDVNPKRVLPKDKEAKFVSMTDLEAHKRKVTCYTIRPFNGGGSKFKNGDTLFARITPCLENGKTAFVDCLAENETAFGSTEFVVFSAVKGKTDPKYVYYLTVSPKIRDIAIKSMTGTSGRQRVETEVFNSISIELPPLPQQIAIGKVLSDIDSKIELNERMNRTLEAIGQALFKRWFVDFEFPNQEGKPYKTTGGKMQESELGQIPIGWAVSHLPEVAFVIDCLHTKKPLKSETGSILLQVYNIDKSGYLDLSNPFYVSEKDYAEWTKNIEVRGGDCVITNAGRVGALVQIPEGKTFGIGRNMTAIRPKKVPATYLFNYLASKTGQAQIQKNVDNGTILDSLNVKGIVKIRVLLPPQQLLDSFEALARPLRKRIEINNAQNISLAGIRVKLLPKLMSGKIRVPINDGNIEAPLCQK